MTPPQDQLLERLKKLPAEIRILIEKRVELYVIEFGENLSTNASKAIAGLVSGLVFLLAFIFALFALAYFVGDVLDNTAAGFAVVAALLLVLGLVVYLLSPELIESRFRDKIAAAFLGSKFDEEATRSEPKELPEQTKSKTSTETESDYSLKSIKPN